MTRAGDTRDDKKNELKAIAAILEFAKTRAEETDAAALVRAIDDAILVTGIYVRHSRT